MPRTTTLADQAATRLRNLPTAEEFLAATANRAGNPKVGPAAATAYQSAWSALTGYTPPTSDVARLTREAAKAPGAPADVVRAAIATAITQASYAVAWAGRFGEKPLPKDSTTVMVEAFRLLATGFDADRVLAAARQAATAGNTFLQAAYRTLTVEGEQTVEARAVGAGEKQALTLTRPVDTSVEHVVPAGFDASRLEVARPARSATARSAEEYLAGPFTPSGALKWGMNTRTAGQVSAAATAGFVDNWRQHRPDEPPARWIGRMGRMAKIAATDGRPPLLIVKSAMGAPLVLAAYQQTWQERFGDPTTPTDAASVLFEAFDLLSAGFAWSGVIAAARKAAEEGHVFVQRAYRELATAERRVDPRDPFREAMEVARQMDERAAAEGR